MSTHWIVAGFVLGAPVVGARLLGLSPTRAGWVPYISSIVTTTLFKKIGLPRAVSEVLLVLASMGALLAGGVDTLWLCVLSLAVSVLEVSCRAAERRILVDPYTRPGGSVGRAVGGSASGSPAVYPSPTVHPELTINLRGPFLRRTPEYDLGDLEIGTNFELTVVIGNHCAVPTQTPVRIEVRAGPTLDSKRALDDVLGRLTPGGICEWTGSWRVREAVAKGTIEIDLTWGEVRRRLLVRFSARAAYQSRGIRSAVIRRYPGGCRGAFAWRGDMDLYDETTHQSVEGLEIVFGLAARYRMPQTMYLSTRLSLDEQAARDFGEHYQMDRGAGRIPVFVEWMKRNVDFRFECCYPFVSDKRFLIELGNHGHLHFGTSTAAARENGWRARAKMGAARYPWLGPEEGSFAEQRDNALEAARLCEDHFGVRPRSWAMPNRTNDGHTAGAMEAAGCEVLSDSNVGTIHNVLFQPPPHHPAGTRAVELTKRFPGDPLDVFDVAMNVFWFHRAHRLGIPVVFMCHQHLRAYESRCCAAYTEYLLRYVLERFNGDLYVNTVFGIGKYWREVLSPETRTVSVRVDGAEIVVTNGSDQDFDDVPVDLVAVDGRRFTRLVSLAAGAEVRLNAFD